MKIIIIGLKLLKLVDIYNLNKSEKNTKFLDSISNLVICLNLKKNIWNINPGRLYLEKGLNNQLVFLYIVRKWRVPVFKYQSAMT